MIRYVFVLSLLASMGRSVLAQGYGSQPAAADYSRIIEGASFEFSNPQMYVDQSAWVGKTVSFVGRFVTLPVITNDRRPFEQIAGEGGNAEIVDVIAFFDTRPSFGGGYGDRNISLTRGEKYRFFGTVQKCREVFTRDGFVRVLPVFTVSLIYPLSDQSFSRPLWVSPSVR